MRDEGCRQRGEEAEKNGSQDGSKEWIKVLRAESGREERDAIERASNESACERTCLCITILWCERSFVDLC